MRARWLGVVAVCVVAIIAAAIASGAPVPREGVWEEDFAIEKVERLARLDLEQKQVRVERWRLDAELLQLQRERICTAKAATRAAMKECARR